MVVFISTMELWVGNLLWIGFGGFCLYSVVVWLFRPYRGWKKWKTLEEYWAANPTCKTKDGNKRYKCCSRNIRQYGYQSSSDHRRVYHCNQCNSGLYRT